MTSIDKLYNLCKNITKDQSVLLFNFIEIYNNMIRYDEFNDIVNCTKSDGFTTFYLASSEGHAPLIEILIKFGA